MWVEPSPNLFKIVKAMFEDARYTRLVQASGTATALNAKVAQIEKPIEALLDRIVDSGNGTMIAAYEIRLIKLEHEKVLAQEKLTSNGKPGLSWKSRSNARFWFFQALVLYQRSVSGTLAGGSKRPLS